MNIGYMLPLITVVICNLFYHLLSKSIPSNVNPFLGLGATYGVAFLGSILLFFATKDSMFANENNRISLFNYLMGAVIIGVEGGYMFMYRVGWEVSKASVIANIVLAVLLVFVGVMLFNETIDLKKIIGIVFCLIGIILLK